MVRKWRIKSWITYFEFKIKLEILKMLSCIRYTYLKTKNKIKMQITTIEGIFWGAIYSFKLCSQGWEPNFVKNYIVCTLQKMEFDPEIKNRKDMFRAFRKEMNTLFD